MKDETFDKLFELSFKTKNRFVTPLILDYFTYENYGFKEEDILKAIKDKYK